MVEASNYDETIIARGIQESTRGLTLERESNKVI